MLSTIRILSCTCAYTCSLISLTLHTLDGASPRGTKAGSKLTDKVPPGGRAPANDGHTTVSKLQQALAKPVPQVTITTATPSLQPPKHLTADPSGVSSQPLIGRVLPVIKSTDAVETLRVGGGSTNLSLAKRSILMSESSSSSESDSESEKELSIVQNEPIPLKSGKGQGKRGYQKMAKQEFTSIVGGKWSSYRRQAVFSI